MYNLQLIEEFLAAQATRPLTRLINIPPPVLIGASDLCNQPRPQWRGHVTFNWSHGEHIRKHQKHNGPKGWGLSPK